MWKLSHADAGPQRASERSLRSEYSVAVMSMSTDPRMPIPCPTRLEAAGRRSACEAAAAYSAVAAATATAA